MGKARGEWARVDAQMPVGRKARRLARLLGDPMAWAYVVALWLYAIRECLGDDLSSLEESEIAEAAGWQGDAHGFVEALVETRWLDRPALGRLILHEFELYNVRFVERQEAERAAARERMRNLRAAARGTSPGTPGTEGTPSSGAGTPAEAGTPAAAAGSSPERSPERSRARATFRLVSSRPVGEVRRGAPGEDPDFDRFWRAYPRRSRRDVTYEAWLSSAGRRPPIDVLLARVEALKASVEWTREGGRYRPWSRDFLECGRWEDPFTPLPAAPPPRREREISDLLGALAAAVPGHGPLRERIRALQGGPEEVERQLVELEREALAEIERSLTADQVRDVEQTVERAVAGLTHLTAHGRRDVGKRLRVQELRRRAGLPVLSLFAPEAQQANP